MRFFAVCFGILIFSVATPVFAQDATDEFYIRVFAGEDTEPPTTPTLLSATAISQTQVDVTWSVATDNFVLSGYIVERSIGTSSTSTIATTTLTNFSDTGLTASTSYTYSVRAFDASGNYSSSSNAITAVTPDFPPPSATTTNPRQATQARVVVDEVVITPGVSTTTFEIKTPLPARFEIRWGRTADYELGFISSDILRREYNTILTDLEPATTYEYEIIGYTPAGFGSVIQQGQFQTLGEIDTLAPANVSRFSAAAQDDDVNLSWQLPSDEDVAFVRIVRSHLGYPSNPTDGAVVYQGKGSTAVDVGVLADYSPAYYTAFVFDTAGNVSSGAIAIVFAPEKVTGTPGGSDDPDESPFVLEPLASTSQMMPDAFDIIVKQGERVHTFVDPLLSVAHDLSFLISLPAEAVSSNLKSIIVQIQDPTDQRKVFSFLLRLNKDRTAYEAVVAPLNVVGRSDVVLSVYDFRSLRVAEYRTAFSFEEITTRPTGAETAVGENRLLWQFLLTVLILLLLIIWWLVAMDRDEDKTGDAEE